MSEYPRETAEKDIGERAEKLLYYRTPDWVKLTKLPLERDYGIDFRVEFRTGTEVTGLECGLQLKGHANADLTKEFIPERIAATTLRYWNMKPYPVLLVSIDLSTERIFSYLYCGGREPDPGADSTTFRVAHVHAWDTVRQRVALVFADDRRLSLYRERVALQETLNQLFLLHIFAARAWADIASGDLDVKDKEAYGESPLWPLVHFVRLFATGAKESLAAMSERDPEVAAAINELMEIVRDLHQLGSRPSLGGAWISFVSTKLLEDLPPRVLTAIEAIYFTVNGSLVRRTKELYGEASAE